MFFKSKQWKIFHPLIKNIYAFRILRQIKLLGDVFFMRCMPDRTITSCTVKYAILGICFMNISCINVYIVMYITKNSVSHILQHKLFLICIINFINVYNHLTTYNYIKRIFSKTLFVNYYLYLFLTEAKLLYFSKTIIVQQNYCLCFCKTIFVKLLFIPYS